MSRCAIWATALLILSASVHGPAAAAAGTQFLSVGRASTVAFADAALVARVSDEAGRMVVRLSLSGADGRPFEVALPLADGQVHRIILRGTDSDRTGIAVTLRRSGGKIAMDASRPAGKTIRFSANGRRTSARV